MEPVFYHDKDNAMGGSADSLPRWNLADYYSGPGDPAIESDLAQASAMAKAFAKKHHGRVAKLSVAGMAEALKEMESLVDKSIRPAIYASLLMAADQNTPAHGKLLTRTQEESTKVEETTLFFSLELMEIPDDVFSKLVAAPEVKAFKHYLVRQRRQKPHRLTEPEEKILAKTSLSGKQAWLRMFHEIIDHQTFKIEGDENTMTLPEVMAQLYSPERARRKASAEAVSKGLEPVQRQAVFLYNTIMLDRKISDELRHFDHPMASRNLDNEMELASVEAMLTACESNHDLCHQFYRMKAKLLGVKDLMDYDRYAPLPGLDRKFSYEEAHKLVMDSFREFSPRMADLTADFFDKDWIDVGPRQGKQGGAFCSGGVPGVHSYVMMNYTGKLNDVKTLAHELGHGVHFELSRRNSLLTMEPTLCLAETASVFGERLVLEKLLKQTTDPKQKLAILCAELEQSFATVFRQVGFTRFEYSAHTARREEGELSAERLNELWLKSSRGMFGDALTIGDHYKTWWSYIPHFIHTPFYCYAYAFGKLLVLALYQLYKEQGESFVPKYMELLSSGGCMCPEDLVKPLGVNLSDPKFWNKGLDGLRAMVNEAEALSKTL